MEKREKMKVFCVTKCIGGLSKCTLYLSIYGLVNILGALLFLCSGMQCAMENWSWDARFLLQMKGLFKTAFREVGMKSSNIEKIE